MPLQQHYEFKILSNSFIKDVHHDKSKNTSNPVFHGFSFFIFL